MSDVVERAKAALEGVTEGPWTWTHGMDARAMVLGPDNLRVKLEGYRDAEFIASARSLVPELIAEVERHRAQETRIRELAERAAVVRAWSEPDGPTCDEANALNALGEDILAALDTEGEQ
ncbi:hypothetical protein FDI61_gp009 [Mycobacterium phage Marvin]|uniref:Uncharacterized protein n=1 Tax=Mycobacterium phage Marvin TaxID=1034139 RepID=G1BN79_9CAUD|nr:hypothetical protein FDI61_gp009 [Mycobacterium phage Marvin]AEJ95293.1 hypothetical protein MARVIN_9 [Mycobacterium phage Marvin]